MQPLTSVVLEGTFARLEPLRTEHRVALRAAAQDPTIWQFMLADPSQSDEAMMAYIAAALADAAQGTALPFVIVEQASHMVCGSTRLFDARFQDRAIEIGHTWLHPRFQRTAINTECKRLLLTYAFEELGAIRVQLKTDSRNLTSQRAIERLGATREGVLRRYQILANGYQRDTVMYSIIADEWPAIKGRFPR